MTLQERIVHTTKAITANTFYNVPGIILATLILWQAVKTSFCLTKHLKVVCSIRNVIPELMTEIIVMDKTFVG